MIKIKVIKDKDGNGNIYKKEKITTESEEKYNRKYGLLENMFWGSIILFMTYIICQCIITVTCRCGG